MEGVTSHHCHPLPLYPPLRLRRLVMAMPELSALRASRDKIVKESNKEETD